MANYWAIAIGINQYVHFQSLTYAERDAQELRNFLVTEAGFSPENCLLLTDSNAEAGQPPPLPDRHHIQSYIAQVCQNRLQADDFLWVFFSGYGVRFQDKDYLMPIEGDPTEVVSSGICMETLFSLFRAAPTSNIFLVLDMNRSQGTLAGEGAGAHTLELAESYGVPTLLSCTPTQFSHETLGLRLGLFTATLIDGLRNFGCTTFEHLRQFMGDRLPELGDHHWRPRQDPPMVVPSEKRYQLIVPGKSLPPAIAPPEEIITPPEEIINGGESSGSGEEPQPPTPLPVEPAPTPPDPTLPPPDPSVPDPVDEGSWERLLKWAAVLGTMLVGLVLLRNLEMVVQTPVPPQNEQPPSESPTPIDGVSPPVDGAPPAINPIPEAPSPTPTESVTPVGSNPPQSPRVLGEEALPQALPGSSGAIASLPSVEQTTPAAGLQATPQPSPGAQGGSGGGMASLPQAAISPAAGTTKPPDQAILEEARATLSRWRADAPSNQVTEIADAIQKLRQIQPGQPLYQDAQQVIDRWSNMILDIAAGRAERRNGGDSLVAAQNYRSAIAAAQLVPQDRVAIYGAAQDAIGTWSQKIFTLATARASEGYLDLAIQVGQQLPPNTTPYINVQAAIATWQQQKRAGGLSR